MPKILAFSGSARKGSFNQKLVNIAASGAEKEGAKVTVINLADYAMSIFNQDLESNKGMPEKAREFKNTLNRPLMGFVHCFTGVQQCIQSTLEK